MFTWKQNLTNWRNPTHKESLAQHLFLGETTHFDSLSGFLKVWRPRKYKLQTLRLKSWGLAAMEVLVDKELV
jgi:hypothetical protein